MNKLIRLYNQNRRKFWLIIIVIIFIFLVIRFFNYMAKSNNEAIKDSSSNNNYTNTIGTSTTPNKSAISNTSVDKTMYQKHENIISNFVELCNNKEIEKAYALLSKDCKEELYPNVQKFKASYYDGIFNKKRTYSIQNWQGKIYIVRFPEDILSTGKVNSSSTIQDYITIVTEDENQKLNINSYIGKEQINKEFEQNNIKIKVTNKKSYMDYEIYDFEIENNIGDTIIMDPLVSTNTIFLTDSKGIKHYAITNEIVKDEIIVKNTYRNKFSIKFDNPYIEGRTIEKITFENIAVGYGKNGSGAYKKIIKYSMNL